MLMPVSVCKLEIISLELEAALKAHGVSVWWAWPVLATAQHAQDSAELEIRDLQGC
jgi:hypothetical protein